MVKKIHRSILKNIFVNVEKEEEWLNKMCTEGYALKDISNGHYIFEQCNSSEYVYRIEFSKIYTSDEDKTSYLAFMKEMNIDLVSSLGRLQYFRRKSCLGKFDIYSDIDSKIKHYKRINFIYYMLALLFIISGLSLDTTIIGGVLSGNLNSSDVVISLTFIIIGICFLILALPLQRKILKLSREKKIHE